MRRAPRLVPVVGLAVLLLGSSAAGPSPLLPPARASATVITYDVSVRGEVRTDPELFARVAAATLRDPRGWSLGGALSFVRVAGGGDVHLVLASPSAVDRAAGICSARYSCQVDDDVLVNDERFRTAVPHWPHSLADYQAYVLNHEVGHWLGLGHRGCPGRGAPAPVMQQQSKSLQGCAATVWPLEDEVRAVARRRGVRPGSRVRPVDVPVVVRPEGGHLRWLRSGAADARWGRPGDVAVAGDWDGDGVATPGVARRDGGSWRWLLTDDPTGGRVSHDLRWGRPAQGDLPVVGDWDGDGRTTVGVVRPGGGVQTWLLTDRTRPPALAAGVVWGRVTAGDLPVAGDWDGDGTDTPGVARPEVGALRWVLTDRLRSPRVSHAPLWGAAGDRAVAGDWDGDGDDSPGTVRGEQGHLVWHLGDDLGGTLPGRTLRWGRPAQDAPVTGR